MNQRDWIPLKILGQLGDTPLAVASATLKKGQKVKPLVLAEGDADEVPGLAMTSIGSYGFEVLSRVHILGSPLPPLEEYGLTDIRSASGLPLLSENRKVRAIPVKPWLTQGQTLAIPANLIRNFCAGTEPPRPIKPPSLEMNPR